MSTARPPQVHRTVTLPRRCLTHRETLHGACAARQARPRPRPRPTTTETHGLDRAAPHATAPRHPECGPPPLVTGKVDTARARRTGASPPLIDRRTAGGVAHPRPTTATPPSTAAPLRETAAALGPETSPIAATPAGVHRPATRTPVQTPQKTNSGASWIGCQFQLLQPQ